MNYNKILDCLGQKCPEPLIKTRYALQEMDSGEILKILIDDPASEGDIRDLIKKRGNKIERFDWDSKKVIIWVKI